MIALHWLILLRLLKKDEIYIRDHSSITSSKRWVVGVRKWQKRWVGLKNSKTWWRNTWMVPNVRAIFENYKKYFFNILTLKGLFLKHQHIVHVYPKNPICFKEFYATMYINWKYFFTHLDRPSLLVVFNSNGSKLLLLVVLDLMDECLSLSWSWKKQNKNK